MGVEPAGRQDQRELVVGRLARVAVLARQEAGPAVGRRETAVEIAPLGPRMVDVGQGHCRFFSRRSRSAVMPAMSHGRPRRQRVNSSQTSPAMREIEARETQRLAEAGEDLPVGQGRRRAGRTASG